jgi:hypothetical protein
MTRYELMRLTLGCFFMAKYLYLLLPIFSMRLGAGDLP